MDAEKLVKMANQIASFFEGEPERADALEGIANHLSRFWEPRMRRELLALVDAGGPHELRTSVIEAIALHRARLAPQA